jgi:hypothetical protein
MFDVRDLVAFRTTAMAFRLAETYAATAFLPAPARTARARAAEAAGRAFAAPATAGNRPPAATRYPRIYPRVALVPPRSTERRVR